MAVPVAVTTTRLKQVVVAQVVQLRQMAPLAVRLPMLQLVTVAVAVAVLTPTTLETAEMVARLLVAVVVVVDRTLTQARVATAGVVIAG